MQTPPKGPKFHFFSPQKSAAWHCLWTFLVSTNTAHAQLTETACGLFQETCQSL